MFGKETEQRIFILLGGTVNEALEGFITDQTTLTEALFRTFLANGNQPLNPTQLAEVLERQPGKILQTISGTRVYKGIRPAPSK